MDQSYYCANCMEKISAYQDTCPYCSFQNTKYIPPSHALSPMTVLQGRYLIGRVLGAGGFGITYVARDLKVEKKVCIKEFFVRGSMYREGTVSEQVSVITDGNVSERLYYANMEKFEQEAKILGRFDNVPGIVGVSDYFHENNTAYIVMEYLEGITLKAYVQSRGGKIPWEDLSEKLRPVFSSLQALHDQGVYHRDISPDNIMLLKDGSLKVFDFGGARIDTDGHGASAMIIRKIGYSPIEQYSRGKQGPWTDVYALAATLYFCLTRKPPADSTDRAGEIDALEKFDSLNVRVPRNVEKAIYKGLNVKPDDRFQSMSDFQQALYSEKGHTSASFLVDQKEEKRTSAPSSGGSSRSGHKGLIALIIAALLIAAGAGAYFYFMKTGKTGENRGSDEAVISTEMQTGKEDRAEEESSGDSDSDRKESEAVHILQTAKQETEKKSDDADSKPAGKAESEGSSETALIMESELSSEASSKKEPETVSAKASEKETESVSEKISEKDSGKPAEKTTEKPTEIITEKPTEKTTEKPTEKTTEKPTEKATEKPTEKVTEKPTEKPEPESDSETVSETEKVTEASTPENEIDYIGSYQIITPDGLTVSRESGKYDSLSEELSHLDEAQTYVIAQGNILFVDTVAEFGSEILGHTDYCGKPGWFVWPESTLKILSRDDISAKSGSMMYLSSQDANVEMRDAPNSSSSFSLIPNSAQVCEVIQDPDDGWVKVTIGDSTGWIESSNLSLYVTDAVYQVNPFANADLLTAPEAGAGVLATVPAGTQLYVDAIENGFGKTAYGEYTGWVNMNLLGLVGDSTIVTTADQLAKPEETASAIPRDWTMNQLIEEHGATGDLGESGKQPDMVPAAFGVPEWDRASITGIYVRDNLDGMPENAVDLSVAKDGGVMGWIDSTGSLIIAGEGGVRAPDNCAALFAYYTNASVIDLGGNLHTENTNDFEYFFYHCENAQVINVSGMNTSMATKFIKMFTACKSLQALDLSTFDTSQAQTFYYMFQLCESLGSLDLTSFTTTNVTQYSGMFRECSVLQKVTLDPGKFDTTMAVKMNAMFQKCTNLQSVNVEHFNMNNVLSTNNMFSGCVNLSQMGPLNWTLLSCPRTEEDNANGMFEDCPLSAVYGTHGEAFFPPEEEG